MEENNSKLKNIIGVLLIMPIYILIFLVMVLLKLQINSMIWFPILMYLPIIIGTILLYKNYKKLDKSFIVLISIFLVLALVNFYNAYYVDYDGWDGLGYAFSWLFFTLLLRISLCIIYVKAVSKKYH